MCLGVVYVSDNYGIYLAINIVEECDKLGIRSVTIGFAENDESIKNAVDQLSKQNKYVSVLCVHDYLMTNLSNALIDENLHGYPYYYIGVDSWFDEALIEQAGIQDFSDGYIGTLPWYV